MCKYSDCIKEINQYFVGRTNPSFTEASSAFAFKVESTNVVGIYYDNIVYYYSITKLTNETDKDLIKRLGLVKIISFIQEHINHIMDKYNVDRDRILYVSYRTWDGPENGETFTYNSLDNNIVSLTTSEIKLLYRVYRK